MNTKVASKALETRVRNVIQNLVNHNQTACVKNRFIEEFICIPSVPKKVHNFKQVLFNFGPDMSINYV